MKRQGGSARKPPEPTDSHGAIDDWMARVMPDLQPIVRWLDEKFRQALPEPRFALKWKKAYYGVPEHGWVIEMVAYDVSVNVVFFSGADLDPSPPLGQSGKTRYVKVKTLEEAQSDQMSSWIEQAGSLPGWR